MTDPTDTDGPRLPIMCDDPAAFRDEQVRRKAAEANRDEVVEQLESCRARLSEVERERDQLVNVCKLAEVLIQPTDDGPQLIGHSSFRERLMHAVRYNKPVAESDIPNPVAAPVQRDANPLGRYADFTEQQCREALANISGVLCDLDYCAVPADPREYGRALREWLARSDTKAVQRDGGKGRDETKPPPGWRWYPSLTLDGQPGEPSKEYVTRDDADDEHVVGLHLRAAWRKYDTEHGYAPPLPRESAAPELRKALESIFCECEAARRKSLRRNPGEVMDTYHEEPEWVLVEDVVDIARAALRGAPSTEGPCEACEELIDAMVDAIDSLVAGDKHGAIELLSRHTNPHHPHRHQPAAAHRDTREAERPPDGTAPERARIVVTVPPGVNAEELQGAVVSGIAASNMRTADYEAAAESVRIEPAARPHDGMPGERCPSCGGQPRGDGLRCSYCGGEGTRAAYDRVTLGMPGEPARCGARDWFSPRRCDRPAGHEGEHDDSRYPVDHDWSTTHGPNATAPPTVPGEPARCGHRYTHTEVIAGRQRVTCLDCREWMPVGIPVDAPPTVPGEPPLSGCTDEGHRQSAEARAIRDAFIATREPPAPPTVPGEPARCEFCDGDTSEGQWSICRNCMGCLSQTRAAPPTVPGEPPHDADLLRIFREHEDGGWVVNATTRATIFSESEARRMAAALAAPPTPPRAPVDEAARADERTAVLQYLDERVREERKYPSRDTGVIACIAAAIRAGEHTDSARPIDAPVDEAAVRADERSCWALAAREEADFHMRIPTEASQRAAAALKGLASAMEADALDTYAKFHNNRRPRTSGPTPEGAAR